MSMGQVYVVVETFNEGNDDNIIAAFTNRKDAEEYADSKQGIGIATLSI